MRGHVERTLQRRAIVVITLIGSALSGFAFGYGVGVAAL
jgi:hypothetical protein